MRGSSYIELPAYIRKKRACVNVQNFDDDHCSKWAVLSTLRPAERGNKNPGRHSNYQQHENELNFAGIAFPVMPNDVPKFKHQNDVSINVYILQKKKECFIVAPIRITGDKGDRHVHLLLIQNYYADEEEPDKPVENDDDELVRFHYVWMKDLSRLVSGKQHICDRCIHYFRDEGKLIAHEIDCSKMNYCSVTLPSPGNDKLKFKNFKHMEKVQFVVYADFECIRKKSKSTSGNTQITQIHEPCSVGYYIKCSFDDNLSRYTSYRGTDPAQWFFQEL